MELLVGVHRKSSRRVRRRTVARFDPSRVARCLPGKVVAFSRHLENSNSIKLSAERRAERGRSSASRRRARAASFRRGFREYRCAIQGDPQPPAIISTLAPSNRRRRVKPRAGCRRLDARRHWSASRRSPSQRLAPRTRRGVTNPVVSMDTLTGCLASLTPSLLQPLGGQERKGGPTRRARE